MERLAGTAVRRIVGDNLHRRVSGEVDCVQWSGVLDNPLPTDWTTVGYAYDPAGRRMAGPSLVTRDSWLECRCADWPDCVHDVRERNSVRPSASNRQSSIILHQFPSRVVALSDAAGEAAVLYEYGIYGQVAASDPNHPNPFLFTGREFDKETGLYYYRARYYNPYIGRFLQTDPAGDGMNPYAYCANNALNCVDPSGMISGYFLETVDGLLRYQATTDSGDPIRIFCFADDEQRRFGGLYPSPVIYDPRGDKWSAWDRQLWGYDGPEWLSLPALAILAHELEHSYQHATWEGGVADLGQQQGTPLAKEAEELAMMAENAMAYAFYKNVPGYGKGGYREISPRTYYWVGQYSLMAPYAPYPVLSMSWDKYWAKVEEEDWRPAY